MGSNMNMNQNFNNNNSNNFNPDVNNQDMSPNFAQNNQMKNRQLLPNPNMQSSGVSGPPGQFVNQQQQQQQQHMNVNQQQQQQQQPPQSNHFLLAGQASMTVGGGVASQNTNTTLILKRVPADFNRVDRMRSHFSKFGMLVEIMCQYEGQPDATLIRFANNQQTTMAYKSPQPVFNNRFIRVYWFSHYLKQQQQQQQTQQHNQSMPTQLGSDGGSSDVEPQSKRLAKDRLSYEPQQTQTGADVALRNKENKSLVKSTSSGSITKTIFNEGEFKFLKRK
jgi:hypothetical protein